MNKIKFSNKYTKMLNNPNIKIPKDTELLEVFKGKSEELHKSFLFYDTQIEELEAGKETHYNLPKGEVIILILFTKNKKEYIVDKRGMLWTTIRRYTPEKHDYYMKSRGKTFNIEMIK